MNIWELHAKGEARERIAEKVGCDKRTVRKIIAELDNLPSALVKTLPESVRTLPTDIAVQVPQNWNVETNHKQIIRELAAKVSIGIGLPLEFASFIEERTPGDWFIGDGFLINISESGKIEPVLEVEHKEHLYKGLLRHLHTGGFENIIVEIIDWKRDSGEILAESQKLLKILIKDVGNRQNVNFTLDSLEQVGFTPDNDYYNPSY
ncbi:hypothetical protein ACFLVE_02230 [Chloroflexota bacterium]